MPERMTSELKLYSNVQSVGVEWLWYPYIPYGKITLLQGDPGEGKSTMMMDIIARISRGGAKPDGRECFDPQRVIYQCSEDGAADTIKPRLEACGANCRNVAFLDEEHTNLTLNDGQLKKAVEDFKARLVVIDPFQAYVSNDGDMTSAVKARRIMQHIGGWAASLRCAVVLIGHLNKGTSGNDLYRSLGSIDVAASARSIIQVSGDREKPGVKVLHHVKSNLAQLAEDSIFEIGQDHTVRWLSCAGVEPEGNSTAYVMDTFRLTSQKQETVAETIMDKLSEGPVLAQTMRDLFDQCDVSMKTVNKTKAAIGVKSIRKNGQWYWSLPDGKN